MGRKTTGIRQENGEYEVDRIYKKQRIRKCRFASFSDAEKYLTAAIKQIDFELITPVCKTFEDAATHYINTHAHKASIEMDIYGLKAVMPHIGHLKLDQVYNATLQPFIDAMLQSGRKSKTINNYLAVVRRILNLSARDWRDENGVPWLNTPPLISMLPLIDQTQPRPIMWHEQRTLLPLLPDHLAEMALFVLNTGVRDEVVCNLQWSWEVPMPNLCVSAFIVPPEHVKGTVANKRSRVLICNTVAQSVIERQRGKHPTHVFVYRRERKKKQHIEPLMEYRPIDTMNNTGWQSGRKRAELSGVRVHDLRHTVGLRLRESGIPESTISAIFWHAEKTITAHYSMAQVAEIFDALEKIKDESNRNNVSLQSLILEAGKAYSPQRGLLQKKTG